MRIDFGDVLLGQTSFGQALRIMVLTLLGVYILLNLFAFFFAERLIFPAPIPTYQDTLEIFKLTTQNNQQISALYLPNPQAKFTVLYSHGNGSDLGSIRAVLEEIRRIGFSVFAYDYQGYGTSEGSASEQNTYHDIHAAFQYLTQTLGVTFDRIILYGFSVGSGPSIDLATRQSVAGVIVEGAFTSAFRVVTYFPILLFDHFRNIDKIQSIHCPLLVIHGVKDEIIPFHHGQTLFNQAKPPKQFLVIEEAGHNNLIDAAGSRYADALKAFARQIEQPQA